MVQLQYWKVDKVLAVHGNAAYIYRGAPLQAAGMSESCHYLLGNKNLNINPYPAKLIYLNFQSLEVVSRYCDPQLQVAENYWYLLNLSTNICKSWCLDTHFIPNNRILVD